METLSDKPSIPEEEIPMCWRVGLYGGNEVTPTALKILKQAGCISAELELEAVAELRQAGEVSDANTDITYIAGYPKIAA